ncbi:MAG: PQQ-dependent sugar dehydrogenase [Cyclobacteriaceae bacterium]|nr:PQQ-dependent sugar dehydrogenase [Cyclobacteriaceae bacterium]
MNPFSSSQWGLKKYRGAVGSVFYIFFLICIFYSFTSCDQKAPLPPADPDNGGLALPEGFEAVVVVDSLAGRARQMAVSEAGNIYIKLRFEREGGGNVVLSDTTGDGKADVIQEFGQYKYEGSYGTAMRIYNGYLYFSTELAVYRSRLIPGQALPDTLIETIVIDDHAHGRHEHIAKPLSFDNKGFMYVPYGAPSNACQEPKRTPGQAGQDPCPQLEQHAGVWVYAADKPNQTQKDGRQWASGIRSVVAMDWNPVDENLYIIIHGRDDLLRLFPSIYDPWQSAVLPAEELIKVTEGSHFGWPYCYYDQVQDKKVLAPEYGGDGNTVGRCSDYDLPLMGFPGHWAPNDLVFYHGDQYPERYKNGAFAAFHGSTNRAPYPQAGYFVCFIPFENGVPTGKWEVFADGFAGTDPIVNVSDATYRPMGIAEGPDGSLYLSETEKGKVWRVMYKGDKGNFGSSQLTSMEEHKQLSHIRTPDITADNLQKGNEEGGEYTYYRYCSACHQMNGRGASGRFPPLQGTDWVTGNKDKLIEILLHGMEGPIIVNGEPYNNLMPQHSFLSDKQAAEVLTFIRSNFGNEAEPVSEQEVQVVRQKLAE